MPNFSLSTKLGNAAWKQRRLSHAIRSRFGSGEPKQVGRRISALQIRRFVSILYEFSKYLTLLIILKLLAPEDFTWNNPYPKASNVPIASVKPKELNRKNRNREMIEL